MKNNLRGLSVVMFCLYLAGNVWGFPAPNAAGKSGAGSASSSTTTIEGLVRDIACPLQNKQATATQFNLKCALECARLGSPLAILTPEGVLYTPISASMPDRGQRDLLMPYVGKYVQVRGQVLERSGMRGIIVQKITEVKGKHLITDAQ